MCNECDRLYSEACRLENSLRARLWWNPSGEECRLLHLLGRAKERRERRGEALAACRDAERESLAWAEAQADYAAQARGGESSDG